MLTVSDAGVCTTFSMIKRRHGSLLSVGSQPLTAPVTVLCHYNSFIPANATPWPGHEWHPEAIPCCAHPFSVNLPCSRIPDTEVSVIIKLVHTALLPVPHFGEEEDSVFIGYF